MYLLRCPCHRCRGFPWLRDTRPLAILIGRCSASHWPPECIVRCCCRVQDNPLGTGNKHTVKKKKKLGQCEKVRWVSQLADRAWNRFQPIYIFEGRWCTGALNDESDQYFAYRIIFKPGMQQIQCFPLSSENPLKQHWDNKPPLLNEMLPHSTDVNRNRHGVV